jgi:hypothetical protein
MKGQGAKITEYEGEPFDLQDTIDQVAVPPADQLMTVREWVVLILTESDRPLSNKELVRVIAAHRKGSPTRPGNSAPPTTQNVNLALTHLRDRGEAEVAGVEERTDVLGRNYRVAVYRLAE